MLLIDKPDYVGHIKNFDKMVTELSPFMTEDEVDKCIGFMHTLKDTKHDISKPISGIEHFYKEEGVNE